MMRRKIPVLQGNKVYWVYMEGSKAAGFIFTCPELDIMVESLYVGGGLNQIRNLITGSQYEPTDEGEY
jgi:hypothetical protein